MDKMTVVGSTLKEVNGSKEDNGNTDRKEKSVSITPRKTPPAVSASRLPHHMLIRIFQYVSLGELKNCMLVCKHWNNVLSIEDSAIWKNLAKKYVPECALVDPYLLSEITSFKKKLRAFFFAWNTNDVSKNNYVRTNGFTVHRQPVAQSTDGVRGKIGISSGIHAFDLTWDGPLGTVAVIGLATRHAALHCPGYIPLLGSDDQSWGLNLVDNSLLHNGEQYGVYPRIKNPPKYQMGEKIRMVVDCDRHQVYFERNSDFLGIAFSDLPPVKLYPAICAVYGNTEVSMVYVGAPHLG